MDKKIHYVIASYPGKKGSICRDRLVDVYPHPELYLRKHLEYLLKIKHNLSQITIMKAKPDRGADVWPNFYNVEDLLLKFQCPIEMIDCPNFGLSYGQYFEAYQRDCLLNRVFDYYCFIEEDYTGSCDDFDLKLLQLHQQNFETANDESGIGYLCSWAPISNSVKFHAAHEFGLISTPTLQKLYEYWNQNPSIQLRGLVHGNVQLKYSDLFVLAGIKIKDFAAEYYTPFYNGVHKKLINCSRSPKRNETLFIPIQMVDYDLTNTLHALPLVKFG